VADQPGRKADLDKEGIVFADAGKAELDKDGITLESQESLPQEETVEAPPPEQEAEVKPKREKRLILMAAGGAAGLLILVIILTVVLVGSREKAATQAVNPVQTKKENVFRNDGMVLDPFMVFYETQVPKKSGVLVAQVSLKVDPAVVPTIESRLYDIRRIIFRRLTAAASVYSQTEITLMLSDDLMDYPIQEVAFVQYNAR